MEKLPPISQNNSIKSLNNTQKVFMQKSKYFLKIN